MWVIYCHRNKSNNKRYIGLTKDTQKRWRNGYGYKNNHHKVFAAAIEKYGWDSFEHIILEDNISTLEEANNREKYWIAYFHTYIGDPACWGYNCTLGGDGSQGRIISKSEREYRRKLKLDTNASESTKIKMSLSRRGKKQKLTEAKLVHLDRLHKTWQGQHHSEKTCYKIAKASFGRKHSKATKQKISNTLKNKNQINKKPNSGKKLPVRCIETGIVYPTITEASHVTCIAKSSISSCLAKRRHIAGSYHWEKAIQ